MTELPVINKTMCPMQNNESDLCPHSLEGILSVISRSWNMMIIGTVGNYGYLRFSLLKQKLGKISPKTLVSRLKELEHQGFLSRQAYAEIPPRVEYSLTKKAKEFYHLLSPIVDWAKNYDH